jgi:FG-GAP-like repeat/Glycosyl hydrolases family 16
LVEANPADGKPGHTGFLYSYGYIEWHVYIVGWGGEAQGCPKGGCIPDWPALWSFPENEENEIDTMEGLRREPCHTWWHHVSPIEETQGCQTGSYAGWHTYGADWEPGVIKFYYDGAQVGEVNSGYINSTPQYPIMDDVPPNGHGDQLVVPDEIVVDYARVWQHPVPPSATTAPPTAVQFRRATLNGTVNPNGFDTHDYFQYGTSTSYGSTTGEVDAGSGTSAVGASATITGLEPNTTYHYRTVATNAGGTTYGGDGVLTTAGPPVITLARPSEASMTLSWTASANAVSYTIMRNGVAVQTTTSLTYMDSKLHAATFYRYEVVANEESESAGSTTITRATTPLSTLATDVNADGKTDLAYLYPGGYIDSFLSLGTGTYEEKQVLIEENFDVAGGLWLAGNVAGNGRSSLIYIYPGGYIETFLSNGNGTYERRVQEIPGFNGTGGTWEVGDFNGDGKTDLVYLYNNYIDTFLSKGTGIYEEKQEEVNSSFNSTAGTWAVGDFNGDGKADLAYVVGKYIDTFLSNGNGTYEEKQEEVNSNFNSTAGQWRAGDANHDGKADLTYVVGKYIDTFLSNGNGTYEEKQEEVNSSFNSTLGIWL